MIGGIGMWIWILAVICAAIVMLLLALSVALFAVMVRRDRHPDQSEERFLRRMADSPLAGWVPKIREGTKWISETPHEDVRISSDDGLRLHGRLYLQPQQSGNGQLMLLSHGFHSSAPHDFSCICTEYFQMGYHLLLIDQRAHGESAGTYICFGAKERYDVRNWCRYLAARFPGMKVVLSGVSMGATTVLLTAALDDLPENVAGVIADCGFTSPYDEFRHVLKDRFHLFPAPILFITGALCRWCAGFDIQAFDTVREVPKIRVPVLFVHGEADTFVLSQCSCANYEACTSPKELVLVPNAGHGMSWLVNQSKCRAVLTAFLEKL